MPESETRRVTAPEKRQLVPQALVTAFSSSPPASGSWVSHWVGNPMDQAEARRLFPERFFAPPSFSEADARAYIDFVSEMRPAHELLDCKDDLSLFKRGAVDALTDEGFAHTLTFPGLEGLVLLRAMTVNKAALPAAHHFRAARVSAHVDAQRLDGVDDHLDAFTVELGDLVEVYPSAEDSFAADGLTRHHMILEITELFQDAAGVAMAAGEWWLRRKETILRTEIKPEHRQTVVRNGLKVKLPFEVIGEGAAVDDTRHEGRYVVDPDEDADERLWTPPEQIWRASSRDRGLWLPQIPCVPLSALRRKVTVKKKPLDAPLRVWLRSERPMDYWWCMEHSVFFNSFTTPQEDLAAVRERWAGKTRHLRTLEVYSGCGGTSAIAQRSRDAAITSNWSVDIFGDACLTYAVNHPETWVWHMGVEEWLAMCVMWQHLWEAYRECSAPEGARHTAPKTGTQGHPDDVPRWHAAGDGAKAKRKRAAAAEPAAALEEPPPAAPPPQMAEVEAIVDMRYDDTAVRMLDGQAAKQLHNFIAESDCFLAFRVRFAGAPPHEDEWKSEAELAATAPRLLHEWVHHYHARGYLPLQHEVDVIAGGPPCQSVSGNNRQGRTRAILEDKRNRQVLVYYKLLDWFRPTYVLMEQVLDIQTKEDGIYVKTSIAEILRLGYQTRTGNLTTGAYGCPQGRIRTLVVAAAPGEMMPPFPEPTHIVKEFDRTVKGTARFTNVGFTSEASVARAHPPVLLADAFDDLPPVANMTFRECCAYAGPPTTPFQVFMRRRPPPWEASAEERVHMSDQLCAPLAHACAHNALKALACRGAGNAGARETVKRPGGGKAAGRPADVALGGDGEAILAEGAAAVRAARASKSAAASTSAGSRARGRPSGLAELLRGEEAPFSSGEDDTELLIDALANSDADDLPAAAGVSAPPAEALARTSLLPATGALPACVQSSLEPWELPPALQQTAIEAVEMGGEAFEFDAVVAPETPRRGGSDSELERRLGARLAALDAAVELRGAAEPLGAAAAESTDDDMDTQCGDIENTPAAVAPSGRPPSARAAQRGRERGGTAAARAGFEARRLRRLEARGAEVARELGEVMAAPRGGSAAAWRGLKHRLAGEDIVDAWRAHVDANGVPLPLGMRGDDADGDAEMAGDDERRAEAADGNAEDGADAPPAENEVNEKVEKHLERRAWKAYILSHSTRRGRIAAVVQARASKAGAFLYSGALMAAAVSDFFCAVEDGRETPVHEGRLAVFPEPDDDRQRDAAVIQGGEAVRAPGRTYLQRMSLLGDREAPDPLPAAPGPVDWTTGWEVEHALHSFKTGSARAELRGHKPHTCNLEDFMRIAAVPPYVNRYYSFLNHNFRDWAGVTTNIDGTACGGHFHAWFTKAGSGKAGENALSSACPGFDCRAAGVQHPGIHLKVQASREKDTRVDHYLKHWSAPVPVSAPGCPSFTVFLPTRHFLCPRYAITFQGGKSTGNGGCFGRVVPMDIQPTVVTRPEPHNLRVVHPTEDRVVTPREAARFQGFPDYYQLVGTGDYGAEVLARMHAVGGGGLLPHSIALAMRHQRLGSSSRLASQLNVATRNRYTQAGNAVSPVLAAAMGRMMCAAAVGATDQDEPVLFISNPEWDAAMEVSRALGLVCAYEELVMWAASVERAHVLGALAQEQHPPRSADLPADPQPPAARDSDDAAAQEVAGSEYTSANASMDDDSDPGVNAARNAALFALVKNRKALLEARRMAAAQLGVALHSQALQADAARGPRDVSDWDTASDVGEDAKRIERLAEQPISRRRTKVPQSDLVRVGNSAAVALVPPPPPGSSAYDRTAAPTLTQCSDDHDAQAAGSALEEYKRLVDAQPVAACAALPRAPAAVPLANGARLSVPPDANTDLTAALSRALATLGHSQAAAALRAFSGSDPPPAAPSLLPPPSAAAAAGVGASRALLSAPGGAAQGSLPENLDAAALATLRERVKGAEAAVAAVQGAATAAGNRGAPFRGAPQVDAALADLASALNIHTASHC